MSLTPGTRLGPYEILALIGAGGMGEIYRARDPRLGRDVAIKVSSQDFSERFEREAHAIAALNHPNICQIYDVGPNYLVMELIDGSTLKGPLPVAKTVEYAGQILDALDAAHRKGIIHLDLKPGNILVTKQGIKLLDFGLARMAPGADDATLTQAGTVMGTPAYMAPEQWEGKVAGAQADIFAFGCVLYEMLTGKLAAKQRMPLESAGFERIVVACLAPDPDGRFESARDLKRALAWATDSPNPVRARPAAWVAATVFLAVVVLTLGFIHFRGPKEDARVMKLSVLPPEKATFDTGSIPAVSPDGRRLAFVVDLDDRDFLWVRDLDSLTARPLTGTDGAYEPFWSPDGRFIAFFADGKLRKISAAGGPVLALCDAPVGRGGSWSKDDVIVFAPNDKGGLLRVAAAGGNAAPVTELDQALPETSHRLPWFLPDGRHFLYTAWSTPEKTAVYIGDLNSKTRRRILNAVSNAVYTPPGYLLFLNERTLMAQSFDAGKAEITGDPMPIADRIDRSSFVGTQGQFSTSQNGVLAYASGAGANRQLTWFDQSGKMVGTIGQPGMLRKSTISPDGSAVVVDRADLETGFFDLWIHDLTRGTASRFTFNSKANDENPIWSPNGSHIAFSSSRDGGWNMYQKATSGAVEDELLDKTAQTKHPLDWSSDGRYIVELVIDPKTRDDIWVLPLFGDRKPFPFLNTEFNEDGAKLSPNGQWLAYTSDETKRFEVYVQSFPTPLGKLQVSTDGGDLPVWSRDGKELYFIGPRGKMMAVEVKPGSKFEASLPKPLFDTRPGDDWFDVSKDGRFLIPTEAANGTVPLTVVVNWTTVLQK